MEAVTAYFKEDRLAQLLGVQLVEVGKGRAKTRLVLQDSHMNAAHMVHGGAIFTLAACAFFAAANSHGTLALGINASVTFLKAVRGGELIAEAVENSVNPRLGSYTVTVHTAEGELIATFQGLAYRRPERQVGRRA